MPYLQSLLLGVLQGLTEFLPVSSSGHLVILQRVLNTPSEARMTLVAVLHLGTSAALLVYFSRKLARIVRGALSPDSASRDASRRTVCYIVVATIPAGIAGLLGKSHVESAFSSTVLVGLMLLVTGAIVFTNRFAKTRDYRLDWRGALAIGLAQMIAVLPGISRSGATVAMALFLGMPREDAFEFSFLLSVPIVLAAAVKEVLDVDWHLLGVVPVVLGVAAAFLSGMVALVLLHRAVVSRRFHWFAFYCWAVGFVTLLFFR